MRVRMTLTVDYDLNEAWYHEDASTKKMLSLESMAMTKSTHLVSDIITANAYAVKLEELK